MSTYSGKRNRASSYALGDLEDISDIIPALGIRVYIYIPYIRHGNGKVTFHYHFTCFFIYLKNSPASDSNEFFTNPEP